MSAFSWSQYTYGGSTACTAISAFGAASFADGFAPPDVESRLRLLTQAGCALWSKQHHRSQSVQEILDVEPFFSSSYDTTSWQCGPKEYQLTLTALLAQPEFASPHWGAVVTDGVGSVSVGRNGGTYCEFFFARAPYHSPPLDLRAAVLFDSHGARFEVANSPTQLDLSASVNCSGTTDVTLFRRTRQSPRR